MPNPNTCCMCGQPGATEGWTDGCLYHTDCLKRAKEANTND